ncbi:MAG: FtsW/RodA/SpoVE family cell cycle protein [Bacteroidetes bacterium]|nr:FtsW/RodA/SpoVE family cell cycle protein [Bacteroidota bacterium]
MADRPEKSIDWATLSLYLALIGIGWLSIYTVGYGDGYPSSLSSFIFDTDVGKQTIWIGIALVLFFFVYIIEKNFWQTFSYIIYAAALLALILVLVVGKEINGAKSWFAFGGFTLQPSEFAKFGTCLAIASYVSRYEANLKNFREQLTAVALFMAPVLLVLAQPDAGSAIVFMSFFILLYREGFPATFFMLGFLAATLGILALLYDPMYIIPGLLLLAGFAIIFQFKNRKKWILPGIAILAATIISIYLGFGLYSLIGTSLFALALAIGFFIRRSNGFGLRLIPIMVLGSLLVFGADYGMNEVLQPHQQDRINAWLNPEKLQEAGRQGSLYNLEQSKMAIGSGGIAGRGFLKGSHTKGNFVPEQSTDFIFCTIGEEQGFLGSASIILIFLFFILRILTLAERQRSTFARAFAYGVAGIFFIHFVINIGMTMGLVPIIGIPLPFISKGGSALLGFTLLVGVLLKLDRYR